jgi:hypothetical protein
VFISWPKVLQAPFPHTLVHPLQTRRASEAASPHSASTQPWSEIASSQNKQTKWIALVILHLPEQSSAHKVNEGGAVDFVRRAAAAREYEMLVSHHMINAGRA